MNCLWCWCIVSIKRQSNVNYWIFASYLCLFIVEKMSHWWIQLLIGTPMHCLCGTRNLSLRLQLQIHWNIVLVNCSSQYLSFVSQCLWFCKFCKIFCCSRIEKAKVFVRLAIIFWMHIWQHWFTGLFWKWLLWFQCWVSLGAFMAPHNF